MRRNFLLLTSLLFLAGCTKYEFQLEQPPELARHIPRKQTTEAIVLAPLEYRMEAYEGRLLMMITNTSDDPILLAGDKSYVVDPDGQSHQLPGLMIAPHTFTRLVFPPLVPVYHAVPAWGYGMGYWRARYPWGYTYYPWDYGPFYGAYFDPYFYGPTYLTIYNASQYWDWTDQTKVTIHLVYMRKDQSFTHEFVIQRVKAK